MTTSPRDITRVLLTALALGGLILLSYRVVQPFVGAGVWAATIVGATWPVMRMVELKLGIELPLPLVVAGVIGGLAALGLVGIFVGPVTLAVAATLLDTWLHDTPQPTAGPRSGTSDGEAGR